ncbi:MAG: radical SAM protein [Deltaproteobacteria bacterium]|nr:radical SAM protein [Deltaproteobacteria bacterium]
MMYEGNIIRPPSEANSLILQVAVGCSHNRCSFCPAYKDKNFRLKTLEQIYSEIDSIPSSDRETVRRVFLCDGDPLIMPHESLLKVMGHIRQRFGKLQRIGIYANAKSILRKSTEQLQALKQQKLGIIYMGLETGDPVTLDAIEKGMTPDEAVEAAVRVRDSGIKLNVTVLLGIGGVARSRQHASATIEVLNRMQPQHVAALTLMVVPGTPLYAMQEQGRFELPDKFGLLTELKLMLQGSELKRALFFSNHASNYFPVNARLPKDKVLLVTQLERIIAAQDEALLRPEVLRGL